MNEEKILRIVAVVLFVFLVVFAVLLAVDIWRFMAETVEKYNVSFFLNK